MTPQLTYSIDSSIDPLPHSLKVTEINYFNGSLHPAPMDSDEDPIHQLITCMERAALLNYKIIHNRLHIREREREREMEMEKMKDEGMVGSSPEAESSSCES